jgi:hypothetical protein
MFQGQLIDQRLRVKIPSEYFQAQKWLNQQGKNERILQLPMPNLWGWEYYNFGFQGAGFNWFGLNSPLLTRDFDRWNLKNEKVYQELSYALYSQDLMLFENLLDKYQIQWIWLDENIIAPEQELKVLFFDETEKIFQSSSKIKIAKEFNKIKIYSHQLTSRNQYAELINFDNPPEELKKSAIERAVNYGEIDVTKFLSQPSLTYNLNFKNFNLKPELCGPPGQNQIFGLEINNEKNLTLKSKNAASCFKLSLEKILKQRSAKDFLLAVSFEQEGEKSSFCLAKWGTDDCLFNQNKDNRFLYQFPQNREIKNYELRIILDEDGESKIKNLQFKIYPAKKTLEEEIVDNLDLSIKKTEYYSLREEKQDTFYFPELTHNQSYALIIEAKNYGGLPLRACLTNYTSRQCGLYADLKEGRNVFFIPISDKGGQGYDINLSNLGIGPLPSINSLKSMKIVPLDYEFVGWGENPQGKIITNNQSYEKNWRAFIWQKPFKIKSLGQPIMINGWENGWLLGEELKGKIIFLFLPQFLEYFGFLFLLILIVLLIIF